VGMERAVREMKEIIRHARLAANLVEP